MYREIAGLALLAVAVLGGRQLARRAADDSALGVATGRRRPLRQRGSATPLAPDRGRGNQDARTFDEHHGRTTRSADPDDRAAGERARGGALEHGGRRAGGGRGGHDPQPERDLCRGSWASRPASARGRVAHEVIRKADLLHFIEEALVSAVPVERSIEVTCADNRWLHAHGTVLHDAPGTQDRRLDRAARRHASATPGERPPRLRRQRLARTAHAHHVDQGLRGDAAAREPAGPRAVAAVPGHRAQAGQPTRRDHRGPADALPRGRRVRRTAHPAGARSACARCCSAAVEMCEKIAADNKQIRLRAELPRTT